MTSISRYLRLPSLFGSGRGVTVPPMDGALKPNRSLEDAPVAFRHGRPDNLVRDGGRLLFSSGPVLMVVEAGAFDEPPVEVARFGSEITALACDGAGGYAVGLDSGEIVFGGSLEKAATMRHDPALAPTAMAFGGRGRLFVCSGSTRNRPSAWKRDLMERNETGSVWAFDLSSGKGTCLASGLAFPYGIAISREADAVLVSESWKHRLLLLEGISKSPHAAPRVVLDDLPGYPARISPSASGYWLAVFAPRGQLMELVLRDVPYRQRMIDTIDSEYWMAPALASGRSFLEPMQLGSLRTMGTLKPWAPTRSYGLLVHLDGQYRPTGSAHSRSDGTRHGITSSVEWGDRVLVASKGGGLVLSLDSDACSGD